MTKIDVPLEEWSNTKCNVLILLIEYEHGNISITSFADQICKMIYAERSFQEEEMARMQREITDHAEWAKSVTNPSSPSYLPIAKAISDKTAEIERLIKKIKQQAAEYCQSCGCLRET